MGVQHEPLLVRPSASLPRSLHWLFGGERQSACLLPQSHAALVQNLPAACGPGHASDIQSITFQIALDVWDSRSTSAPKRLAKQTCSACDSRSRSPPPPAPAVACRCCNNTTACVRVAEDAKGTFASESSEFVLGGTARETHHVHCIAHCPPSVSVHAHAHAHAHAHTHTYTQTHTHTRAQTGHKF